MKLNRKVKRARLQQARDMVQPFLRWMYGQRELRLAMIELDEAQRNEDPSLAYWAYNNGYIPASCARLWGCRV